MEKSPTKQNDYEKELEKYVAEKAKATEGVNKTNNCKSRFHPKSDVIFLKLFPDNHPLSTEEQIYFVKITEGIFGYNEQIRNETIKQISMDYNIVPIASYLCLFVKEAIYTNIALTDLTLLIYAVRMAKSLLSNSNIDLRERVHDILPAILSCALAKKISKYYYDNHWTLRDFSAYVVAMICHTYCNKLNNMTERVINIYLIPIQNFNKALTSVYGAIKGISSLGEEMIKNYLVPNIALLGQRIYVILERRMFSEEAKQQNIEAKHVRDAVISAVSPILYKTHNINDGGDMYIKEFGYLGKLLYVHVKSLEKAAVEKKMCCTINNLVYLVDNNVGSLGQGNYISNYAMQQEISQRTSSYGNI